MEKWLKINSCFQCKHYEDFPSDRGCMTCKKTGRVFSNSKGKIPGHCQLKSADKNACAICHSNKKVRIVVKTNMAKQVHLCKDCYSSVVRIFLNNVEKIIIENDFQWKSFSM